MEITVFSRFIFLKYHGIWNWEPPPFGSKSRQTKGGGAKIVQNRARLRRKFDPLGGGGIRPPQAEIFWGLGALLRRKPVTECTLERGFLCKMGWKTPKFSACGGVYHPRRLNLHRRRARFLAPGKILDLGPISRKQGWFPSTYPLIGKLLPHGVSMRRVLITLY